VFNFKILINYYLQAIQTMYQHKIYGSDKDLLSIVFFGTETKKNCNDFAHVYVIQVSYSIRNRAKQ
jgi:hypothetical protein